MDIDKYFSSPPKIPKKYNAIYTYRDYNKDKVKDNIVHLFTLKGKYILSLPINNLKYKQIDGGYDKPQYMQQIINDQPQVHTIITKDETKFGQHVKRGLGAGGGAAFSSNIIDSLMNAFE